MAVMSTVFSAVLTHSRPERRQLSRGQVEGTPEEAMERVLRYRRASAHIIGNRVIDYMGNDRLVTEYHYQFEPDDVPDDVFTPPWTPTGEPTPWLTKNNDLIGPPPPPRELVGNQFALF